MFITHWIDNAFGGAAFEGGAKGDIIKTFETSQTGHSFATEPCAGAGEDGDQCNALGLTDLGAYLVRRLIAKHMMIETDHLSQKARAAVFDIAEAKDYPLVSSHTGTGGEWTPGQLKRLYRLGGLATIRPDSAPAMTTELRKLDRSAAAGGGTAVGLGTDTGGFSALPGPHERGAKPLKYPFRSFVCNISFVRQKTGTRTFDLNTDGVAHYGLMADLIADVQQQRHGRQALKPFFRSAEAYLEMWERAYGR
jgi:microsomal dipeptidase-like Zn-dependent dipeptidase